MVRTRSQREEHSPTPPPSDLTEGVVDGLGYKVHFCETKRIETGVIKTVYTRCTEGSRWEEDELCCGTLPGKRSEHTLKQIEAGLENKFPTDDIFPMLPIRWRTAQVPFVTVAETWDEEAAEADGTGIPVHDMFYLKRPRIALLYQWDDYATRSRSWLMNIAHMFALEIRAMERLARHPPHPNLVRYHGCRVRQGRVTGILLHRVGGMTLAEHLKAGKPIDKGPFMATLTSAVDHLHNVVGMAHNDIHPNNIMVSADGTTATLIDLGSAEVFGKSLHNRGFSTIGNDPLDMHAATLNVETKSTPGLPNVISRKSRDFAALERLRTWLDSPSLDVLADEQWAWVERLIAEEMEEEAKKDAGNREASSRYNLRSRSQHGGR